MKIQKAIMSVDDNPLYSDFWLPVSKVWKKRFDIEPVLIYFGSKELDNSHGEVIYVKPIEGVPLYLQTQWARFWYTSLEPDTTFVVSDIDMFPISKKYFVKQIADINGDKYVHLNGDVRPICVCYHVARGETFKRVLNLAGTFQQSLAELYQFDGNMASITSHMGFPQWGLDEAYSTKKIFEYGEKDDLVFLSRYSHPAWARIDRSSWGYSADILREEEHYIDSHSLRPYSLYKPQIDKLVNLLIGN
jgi:hypothetical protein